MPFVTSSSMVVNSGAGGGAKAFSISLNRSIAVPVGVVGSKSVKRPSSYVPSSASPMTPASAPPPEPCIWDGLIYFTLSSSASYNMRRSFSSSTVILVPS